jgi:hypothetical protein
MTQNSALSPDHRPIAAPADATPPASRVSTVLAGLTYATIAIIPFLYALQLELQTGILVLLILLQSGRIIASKIDSSLSLVFGLAFLFLYSFPSLSLVMFYDVNPLPIVAMFVIFSDLFQYLNDKFSPPWTKDRRLRNANESGGSYRILMWPIIWLLALSAFLGLVIRNEILQFGSFIVPYFLATCLLEEALKRNPPRSAVFTMIGLFFLAIIIYGYFYWSGGGRIVMAAYFLIPILVCVTYTDLGLKYWHIYTISPVIFFIAQVIRYGEIEDTGALFSGSASHHLELSQELLTDGAPGYGDTFTQFLEQFSLMFLNWVPRIWWESKPIGLGQLSVDDWFGRTGYGEGFSISLGMFGEHIYLLGDWFILGVIASTVSLLAIRQGLLRMFPNQVTQLTVFDVNLISFFWGGGGTFGTRFWFVIVPALACIWIVQRLFSGGPGLRR